MTKLTLLILAGLALATPASAQGLVATSSAGRVLAIGQAVHPQPDLQERRALAMAAFSRPPSHPRKTAAAQSLATAEPTQIQPRDEWLREDEVPIRVNRIVYRTRF